MTQTNENQSSDMTEQDQAAKSARRAKWTAAIIVVFIIAISVFSSFSMIVKTQ